MTSATLYREAADLDALLAELDGQHPGQVRVLSVNHLRDGGVFGFFARQRVGVHYELAASSPRHALAEEYYTQQSADLLDELIRTAEAADSSVRTPDPQSVTAANVGNAEFAQLVLELAARKSAERTAVVAPEPAPAAFTFAAAPVLDDWSTAVRPTTVAPPVAPPVLDLPVALPVPPTVAAAPPHCQHQQPVERPIQQPAEPPLQSQPQPPAEPSLDPQSQPQSQPPAQRDGNRLELRRQLAELGVPIGWVPDADNDPYRVVTQLVSRLPLPPAAPQRAGSVLVLAGPAIAALHIAQVLRAQLRLRAEDIWAAGCPAGSVPDGNVITGPWQAAGVAATLRGGGGHSLIVIATDDEAGNGHESWAARLIAGLEPDALWALVDATRKPADTQAALQSLGRPDALVVTNAARTVSPASLWDLGVPIALLDGMSATRGLWTVLLMDKLTDLER